MVDQVVLSYRRSPAHDMAEAMEAGSGSAVRLREVPFLTHIGLRAVADSDAAAALERLLGVSLPRSVGSVSEAADQHILWLAPDEYLLVAPDEAESGVSTTDLAESLASAIGSHRGQALDLSANRTTFELHGDASRQVLEKSVRVDLHPRVFDVGQALVTTLGATPAILWRTGDTRWRVLVRASFACHTAAWLLDGMREFS